MKLSVKNIKDFILLAISDGHNDFESICGFVLPRCNRLTRGRIGEFLYELERDGLIEVHSEDDFNIEYRLPQNTTARTEAEITAGIDDEQTQPLKTQVFELINKRATSIGKVCAALKISKHDAENIISELINENMIERKGGWLKSRDDAPHQKHETPEPTAAADSENGQAQTAALQNDTAESTTETETPKGNNMEIQQTLNERAKTHGNFADVALLTAVMKSEFVDEITKGNKKLSEAISVSQYSALEMIFIRLARIACGDPNEVEHWLGIAGYAMLIVNELEKGNAQ